MLSRHARLSEHAGLLGYPRRHVLALLEFQGFHAPDVEKRRARSEVAAAQADPPCRLVTWVATRLWPTGKLWLRTVAVMEETATAAGVSVRVGT